MHELFFQVKRIMEVALLGLVSKQEHYTPRSSKLSTRSFEEIPITYNIDTNLKNKNVEKIKLYKIQKGVK